MTYPDTETSLFHATVSWPFALDLRTHAAIVLGLTVISMDFVAAVYWESPETVMVILT